MIDWKKKSWIKLHFKFQIPLFEIFNNLNWIDKHAEMKKKLSIHLLLVIFAKQDSWIKSILQFDDN